MNLADMTWFDFDQRRRDLARDNEVSHVGNANRTAGGAGWGRGRQLNFISRGTCPGRDRPCRLAMRVVRTLQNEALLLGNLIEGAHIDPKVLRKCLFGHMCEHISDRESAVLQKKSAVRKCENKNSQPSGDSPWIECGIPDGKYQRSPLSTSATKLWPSLSTAVIRALPASMNDDSASLCQCSSRTPPASRMSTPAMVVAAGSSRTVISPAGPTAFPHLHVRVRERITQIGD